MKRRMKRRVQLVTAFTSVLLAAAPIPTAIALEEADRLWMVGERAAADGLTPLARRVLERLVDEHPRDARVPEALLLLGRMRLAAGEVEPALRAFQRVQTLEPRPGRPLEPRFWEAEALFRLKRYAEASAAYDEVVRADAASPFAPDALYGYAWSEVELKRPETAAKALRDFLATWPDHALAASARYLHARALVGMSRYDEAIDALQAFETKHPGHKLAPDVQYLRGWARIANGDVKAGLADLRAFLESHPGHPEASGARQLMTETVVRHGGERDDLQAAYRTLMIQSPPSPEGLYDAAMIAGRLNRTLDQEAAWRRLRTSFPDHPLSRRVAFEMASSAFRRKDWRETVSQARAAAESDDEVVRGEAWLLVGEAELKLRRFASAEKAFEVASESRGADDGLRYRAMAGLGLAREELRDWRGAMAAYDAVAAHSPDPTLRDWARERFEAVKARLSKTQDRPAEKAPERKARARS
jgi:TolA-binding protein